MVENFVGFKSLKRKFILLEINFVAVVAVVVVVMIFVFISMFVWNNFYVW